jgi:hypothetical protein
MSCPVGIPGWQRVTPGAAWTAGAAWADFDRARLALGRGPAVLRDYVKSMKHYWHEAAFIPDLEDGEAAWKIARRLLQLREDEFVGGFVLRRFERFSSAEVRTWWVDGQCVLVGPHPDTPNDYPPGHIDVGWLTPSIGALGMPFVTADLALRTDGAWRLIEIGDGQVSDRPVTIEPAAIIAALLRGSN